MNWSKSGISVYTTLNVQHLDSLNDIVAQVTGVAVRETLPDSVLDRADEIELVDLPVNELLSRLNEGKVYIPDQAQLAMANFFRPGNLIALREMALRRTADRVDAQMRTYRLEHAIQPTWPVTERLIVSIGPSPFSAKLIRAAKRMAERFMPSGSLLLSKRHRSPARRRMRETECSLLSGWRNNWEPRRSL